ncbi:Viral T-cell receptor beta chain-like T17T-22 [Oryzias melastigma]|nr:Viral T-cell receptor beta chain-like T17T-22 [Oryzias melastigma]
MLHCDNANEAYFGRGTKLTVLEQGRNVTPPAKVRVLEPLEQGKKNRTLVCVASGFYPDHVSVSWYRDGVEVTKGVATDDAATRTSDLYRITSRLTVPPKEWFSKSKFTCTVSFFDGTTTTDHSDYILGEDKPIPSGDELTRDQYLWITQSAKLSYIIFIAKSCVYGAFIWFVAWKLQSSREKRGK